MKVLPSYMTPSRFQLVPSLPRLTSGKVDRKNLKMMPLPERRDNEEDEQEQPNNEIEARLLEAARRALSTVAVPLDADFFMDLGGHSLLAARFVSIVRETPSLASVTLQDLYACRTLRSLAALLNEREKAPTNDLSFEPPPFGRRAICALAQLSVLPLLLSVSAAQWLAIFISYILITPENATFAQEVMSLFGIILCVTLATLVISICGKMARHRAHQAGPLSTVGHLFFPMVAVTAAAGAHQRQADAKLAADAAVSRGNRRENRPRRANQRYRDWRDRSRVDRRWRVAWLETQDRQRTG